MNGELPKLEKKLWDLFSKFIRMRDASQLNGYCPCMTCGMSFFWKYMEAGHFIPRAKKEIKFNEQNVNAQCVGCNHTEDGRYDAYAKALDKKYGPGTAAKLEDVQSRFFRFDKGWLQFKIDYYRKEVAKLKKKVHQQIY